MLTDLINNRPGHTHSSTSRISFFPPESRSLKDHKETSTKAGNKTEAGRGGGRGVATTHPWLSERGREKEMVSRVTGGKASGSSEATSSVAKLDKEQI